MTDILNNYWTELGGMVIAILLSGVLLGLLGRRVVRALLIENGKVWNKETHDEICALRLQQILSEVKHVKEMVSKLIKEGEQHEHR